MAPLGAAPERRPESRISPLLPTSEEVTATMARTTDARHARRRGDETGASAVEYGLLVTAIAALIVVIVFALGGVVTDLFAKTCSEVQAEANTTTTC